jgi:SET domain-containing protein
MTIDHTLQIKQLNTYVLTKLAPSLIDGVGVFALKDIKKGTKLYADMMPVLFNVPYKKFNRIDPNVCELLLQQFPQIVNNSSFAYPTVRIQAYMNHSNTPNYDAVNDVVLSDITAGDEITEDYRCIDGYKKVFPFLKE